jgi:hypothetical protein
LNSNNGKISLPNLTAGGWVEYVGADLHQSVTMVRKHRQATSDPGGFAARASYWPLLAGQLRCVNLPDPVAELRIVVATAAAKGDWRGEAYRTAAGGFFTLLPEGATRIKVPRGVAWSNGDLQVKMPNLLGLYLADGSRRVIHIHNKKQPLTRLQADRLLVLMYDVVDELVPGADVVVWDTQRGREFRLRPGTNLAELRISALGLAARYVTEWSMAA